MSSRIIQIGNIFTRASFSNPTVGRVYSVDGLSPTLNTNGGGYHLPMIIVEDNGEQKTKEAHKERQSPDSGGVMLDCYNQRAVEDYSVTITTRINSANHYYVIEETKNGENDIEDMENEIKDTSSPKIAEPYIAAVRGREPNVLTPRRTEYGKAVRREYERGELREPRRNMQRFEPRTDGVSNTLTSVSKDNYLVEPRIDNLGSYKPNGYNGSCVIGEGSIAPTVRENHGEVTAVMHPKYRIRKLTPRECFRLMDVDDADIDKIQGAGICNSQQYKLAGNSIVVNVLYHIFRKMFVEQGNEEQQLKLF